MTDGEQPGGAVDQRDPVWVRLIDQQRWYSTKSTVAQRMYKWVKFGQILVGAVVPVLAVASAPAVVTACVAATVVIAEGAQQLFQWQSNWLRYRSMSETLKREKHLYLAGAGDYGGDDRRTLLAERVEFLVSTENAAWITDHKQPVRTPKQK